MFRVQGPHSTLHWASSTAVDGVPSLSQHLLSSAPQHPTSLKAKGKEDILTSNSNAAWILFLHFCKLCTEEHMNTNASNTSVKVSKCSQSEHTSVTSTQAKKQPPWSLLPLTNPPDTNIGLTLTIFLFVSCFEALCRWSQNLYTLVAGHYVCEIFPCCCMKL